MANKFQKFILCVHKCLYAQTLTHTHTNVWVCSNFLSMRLFLMKFNNIGISYECIKKVFIDALILFKYKYIYMLTVSS